MKKIKGIASLLLLAVLQTANAQDPDFGVWTSLTVKKKLTKGLNLVAEGEYRSRDHVKATERWSGSLGIDYRIWRFLKAEAGYTYIHSQQPGRQTKKGNIIPAYWSPRHRMNVSVSGSLDWGRFSFSLRERWQYTYRPERLVAKLDEDGKTPKADEVVNGKGKNVLRSRLKAEYDIAQCPFTPYVSGELYHSGNGLEKTRWTVGTEYKINKKNALELYYRYQDEKEDEEMDGHVLGIGYTIKF